MSWHLEIFPDSIGKRLSPVSNTLLAVGLAISFIFRYMKLLNVQSLNFTCNQIETSGLQLQAFLVFEKDFFSSDAFVVPGRGMRNPDTISRPKDCCTFFYMMQHFHVRPFIRWSRCIWCRYFAALCSYTTLQHIYLWVSIPRTPAKWQYLWWGGLW